MLQILLFSCIKEFCDYTSMLQILLFCCNNFTSYQRAHVVSVVKKALETKTLALKELNKIDCLYQIVFFVAKKLKVH